ncbi:hypothetical protein [Nannocystis pusilla]|uniref:hypothetical protein n=1 Tax=Nannocystis pusilla TaxID=889268 RepID=UPI003B81C447
MLHTDELRQPPVALVLAVRCPAAFMSRPYCIAHSEPSAERYEHVIALKRDDLRGEVMITPYLVRTLTGPRRPGFAWRKGAWLATAEPWTLCIDEQKPPVGSNLVILRRRFSQDPEIPLADRANWFCLQLEGETPRLLLNDEHAELMRALHDTSTKGKRATIRNVLFELLDATVWPALLLHAARAWHEQEGAAYPWQTNVLRLWAKRMFPDEDDLASGVERLVHQAVAAPSTFMLEVNAMLQRSDQVRLLDRLVGEVYQ